MSRNKGRPPLSSGPVPAILVPPPPSSLIDSSPPGSRGPDLGPPPGGQGRLSYRSDVDEDSRSARSQPRQGDFRQRDPDTYKAEYGVLRTPQRTEKSAKTGKPKNTTLADSPYDVGELQSVIAENRSLKIELQDREGRLELLKIDNDNLIQRLGDARKDRERMEQEVERERRENRERLREMEKGHSDWKDGPHSRILDQTVAEKTELADKVRRLEVELTRERDQSRRLQLQAASVGGAGSKNDVMEAELRRYKADVERLENELRREVMRAEELSSELSSLRHSTVSLGRERDLEAKNEKVQREADSNYKKLQEALTENERLRINRVSADVMQDLNGQIDKLTANIKGKERQIDDLNQEVRKITLAKNELENNNSDLQTALSELKREVQRARVDVDDAKDVSVREVARLRAENERLKTEKDLEQYRTPRRVPSDPDLRIPSIGSPGRHIRSDGQAGPLQDLVKEQESHIADLRREVESLRGAVSDYQKELDRLRVLADDQVMTREKFNDIASAHRRLLDENARLLLLLDKQHQSETRAVTDKTEVARSLSDAKRRLEAGNRRITQLERWLDEIYNDKDFEVVHKRGAYSKGHTCRGAYPQPKAQVPLLLTERRREQIRRLLDESRTATAKPAGYSTDRK